MDVTETVAAPEEEGEVTGAGITGKWVRRRSPSAGRLRDEGGGAEESKAAPAGRQPYNERQLRQEGAEGQNRM